MRIGLVCPYAFDVQGGVQAHVLGLAGWLAAHGHDPAILAPGQLDPERACAAGVEERRFTSTGSTMPVPYNGSVARISFGPVSSLRVRRWLADGDFDVLHVHEPITPSAAVLAVWAAEVPILATFHTATPGSRTMRMARHLMPDTIRRIDAGIAVSRVAAEVVRRHIGLDPRIVGNGITVADFDLRPHQGRWRGGDGPRISFVGRLNEPRKGLGVLLAAVPKVLARFPNADIVIAGAGVPWPAPSQVRYVGAISDRERNELLATSDVFVAPQIGRESFGIVILEALASGAQVVASALPAFVDVLADARGPVGRLAEVGSPESLADAIVASLGSTTDQRRGRTLAARYDWSVIGPQIVDAYDVALGSTRVDRPALQR